MSILGVYVLGTDFKAGQTKFKTAAIEYLRTIGLRPRVVASSNHLGNNDMRNLATAKSARDAKLRVKHDIFAPWEEDIDHKVSVMFTEEINDEKRDFVEYTSSAFLGHTHTMVTYTRASDSVLCVPLMIDAAVWCDFFSGRSWSLEGVARALAYLFKVPEGAAKGVDPGFFRQMGELDTQIEAAVLAKEGNGGTTNLPLVANTNNSNRIGTNNSLKRTVRIRDDRTAHEDVVRAEWIIPDTATIICAGLACLDMQLLSTTGSNLPSESIRSFEGEKSMAGGSVSMATKTFARLCHGAPFEGDDRMLVTPPVVERVVPLCRVGDDDAGHKLLSLLEETGSATKNVDVRYTKGLRDRDRKRDEGGDSTNNEGVPRTALAVLPIFCDGGGRGCFFDAASNANFDASSMAEMIGDVMKGGAPTVMTTANNRSINKDNNKMNLSSSSLSSFPPSGRIGAFIFGYPHLLPLMQGEALAQVFDRYVTMV